jgi:AcrR family transcriptional regulator
MPKVVPEYKEEAKKRIIDAGFRVFSEKGYHETTMADIAKKLGVSKGALYLYFRSKEELWEADLEAHRQALREVFRSALKSGDLVDGSGDLFDKTFGVHAGGDAYETQINPLIFESLSEASRNADLKAVLKEDYEKERGIVTDFLQEQRKKGLIRDDIDIRSLSLIFVALFTGFLSHLVIGIPKMDVRRAWVELIKVMLAGAMPRE